MDGTYVAGALDDVAAGIAVSSAERAFLTGWTRSLISHRRRRFNCTAWRHVQDDRRRTVVGARQQG
jgi:hypothetical protein